MNGFEGSLTDKTTRPFPYIVQTMVRFRDRSIAELRGPLRRLEDDRTPTTAGEVGSSYDTTAKEFEWMAVTKARRCFVSSDMVPYGPFKADVEETMPMIFIESNDQDVGNCVGFRVGPTVGSGTGNGVGPFVQGGQS